MMDPLTVEQAQFNAAIEKYERLPMFRRTGRLVSLVNVGLQISMLAFLLSQSILATRPRPISTMPHTSATIRRTGLETAACFLGLHRRLADEPLGAH